MNIALLTSTFPLNREEKDHGFWILEIIEGLKVAGHRVVVYTQDRHGQQEPFGDIEIERFPWPSRNKRLAELSMIRPLDAWAALRLLTTGASRLPAFLKQNQVDLCLVFWALPSGWFAYLAARRGGPRYRVWALGSDINRYGRFPLVRRMLCRILQNADAVYADSFELAERIMDEYGTTCEFLPTTRTLTFGSAEPAVNDRDKYEFLYVGRFAEVKGIDILMEAAAKLPPNSRLVIAGSGPLEQSVRTIVKDYGAVHVLGRISDKELVQQLATCECVVIPSRSETIPIVLSEALQFGRRMIVTDVGDMGYICRRFRLGEVIPPGDSEALAAAMWRAASAEVVSSYEPDGYREALPLFDIGRTIRLLAAPLPARTARFDAATAANGHIRERK